MINIDIDNILQFNVIKRKFNWHNALSFIKLLNLHDFIFKLSPKLQPNDIDFLYEFDIVGVLHSEKEGFLNNETVSSNINFFQDYINFLQSLQEYFHNENRSNLEISIILLSIQRYLQKAIDNTIESQIENTYKALIDKFISKYNIDINQGGQSNFIHKLIDYSFETYLLFLDYGKFNEVLLKLQGLLSIITKLSDEFRYKYYELWVLNKAFISAPEEVFSYVDSISIAGFLISPDKFMIEKQEQDINKRISLIPSLQILGDFINTELISISSPDRYNQILKVLTQLKPVNLESLYNLAQIISVDETDEIQLNVDLYIDSKKRNINISILHNIEDWDLFLLNLEFESELNRVDRNLDLLEILEDIYDLLLDKEDDTEDLEKIIKRLFKSINEIYLDNNIDIFFRDKGLSVFDFIYSMKSYLPTLFEGLNGDFTQLAINKPTNLEQSIRSALLLTQTFYITKLTELNKLKDINYLNSLTQKRIEYFEKLAMMTTPLLKEFSDHQSYIKKIKDIAIKLDITKENIQDLVIRSDNLEEITKILRNIAIEALDLFQSKLNNNDDDDKLEAVQYLVSLLSNVGLEIDIKTSNKIDISINSSQLKAYLTGYFNVDIIIGKYSWENIFSFNTIVVDY